MFVEQDGLLQQFRVEIDEHFLCNFLSPKCKNRINSKKNEKTILKNSNDGEYDQNILYACMAIRNLLFCTVAATFLKDKWISSTSLTCVAISIQGLVLFEIIHV